MHWFRHQDLTVEDYPSEVHCHSRHSAWLLQSGILSDFPTDKMEAFSHLKGQVKLKDSCSSKKNK